MIKGDNFNLAIRGLGFKNTAVVFADGGGNDSKRPGIKQEQARHCRFNRPCPDPVDTFAGAFFFNVHAGNTGHVFHGAVIFDLL